MSVATIDSASTSKRLPPLISAPLNKSWSLAESFEYCSQLTKSHYENFPVGSVFIPADIRPDVHSLYAFMRTSDDFSDEDRRDGDEEERMAYLNSWDEMLTEAVAGQAKHPIFIALADTIARRKLPVQWLRDLLHAFKMDVTTRRYNSYDDVLHYCRYSANPVGRLILTLFGYRDEELYRFSDNICTGLQLANHWQDVAVDWKKNRAYLPLEDMKRFGVTEEAITQGDCSDQFKKLLAYEVDRAKTLFREGHALPSRVSGRLKWELRVTWLGGWRILKKIEAVDYDVFRKRPTVSKLDIPWMIWNTLFFKLPNE